MSFYDLEKRLQIMHVSECKMLKMEARICAKNARCFKRIVEIKTLVAKHERDVKKYVDKVDELATNNDDLDRFLAEEEKRLHQKLEEIKHLSTEYESLSNNRLEQRRKDVMARNCLRSLKLATQIFVNLKALPERIQGLSLCTKENTVDWKPFCIDPSKHTTREVQQMVWDDTQADAFHKQTWERIILGDLIEQDSVTDANTNKYEKSIFFK